MQGSEEGGGSRTRRGGEAAAVDANCRGRDDDAANGEKIRSTAKETERARATHDVDTLAAMAVAATEGRRKRRHHRSSSSSEEDEAKTIAAIDVGGTNDGADNPDANKDGGNGDGDSDGNNDGDGDGDSDGDGNGNGDGDGDRDGIGNGGAMLANISTLSKLKIPRWSFLCNFCFFSCDNIY